MPEAEPPSELAAPESNAPRHFVRLHAWLEERFSPKARRRLGVAVGFGAALGGTLIAAGLAKRLGLDIPWAAWIGLFRANWIGYGGILVPIPGLRLIGMTMAAHQGAEGDRGHRPAIGYHPRCGNRLHRHRALDPHSAAD